MKFKDTYFLIEVIKNTLPRVEICESGAKPCVKTHCRGNLTNI